MSGFLRSRHLAPTEPLAGTKTPNVSFRRGESLCLGHSVVRGLTGDSEGFSLVELMVTLAVAAVLMTIAVPSFKRIMLSNKLSSTATEVVGALNVARMEAVKRNADTQFCSNSETNNTTSTLGTACGTKTGAVFALTGAPAVATTVRTGMTTIVMPLKFDGDLQAIRYSSQGLGYAVGATAPYDGQIADICTSPVNGTDNHRVISMTAGSILATASSTGACP